MDCESNQETIGQINTNLTQLEQHEFGSEEVKQHPKYASKGIVFGPFAPISTPTAGDAANKKVRQVQDWESLASTYRPQYRNQGAFQSLLSRFFVGKYYKTSVIITILDW